MKTEALIKAIKNGEFHKDLIVPLDIMPLEIIEISDMETLREISKHLDDFKFLTETETWEANRTRQFILGSMGVLITFLKQIAKGECRCLKYKYMHSWPETEEYQKLIEIISMNDENIDVHYECKCTLCNSFFSVVKYEERFGHRHSWSKR